jgi:hypothetical protein
MNGIGGLKKINHQFLLLFSHNLYSSFIVLLQIEGNERNLQHAAPISN